MSGSRFIFLGPPGAGKGTQAVLTGERLGIPSISTGAMFRESIAQNTTMGRQIAQFVTAGLLVPDKLTNAIVAERLKKKDVQKGFILDGYPRSLVQAKALDAVLARSKRPLDRVVYFKVDAAVVIARMGQRRVCSQCGQTYNRVSHPPKVEGRCDSCGGAVVMRQDDQPESIQKRLEVYEESTAPLLAYYEKKGVLVVVNASRTVAEVDADVRRLIEGR